MRVGLSIVEKGVTLPSGVHRYAANLVKAIRTAPEIDSLVLFTHANMRIRAFLSGRDLEGVEVVPYLPWRDNALAVQVWHLAVLPRLARRRNLDVLHVTNGRPARSGGVPLVVTVHDLAEFEIANKFDPARLAYRRWIQHPVLRRHPVLMTVSESARRDIARHLNRETKSIVVVPNYALSSTQAAFDETRRRDLLYVGRIDHPSKNLPLLIQAFDRFADEVPYVRLRLVGSDSWSAEVVHLAAASARHGDRIDFLGWVGDTELTNLLSAAAALCLPSLREGFGLPAAEALAHGTPVLAADTGALPEVLGTQRGLLPPTSPEAWTDAMLNLFRKPGWRTELLEEQTTSQRTIGTRAQAEVTRLLVAAYGNAALGKAN